MNATIGDEFLSRQRVLVIAPHADDETYGCAGTIARVKDLGGAVFVSLISVGSLEHHASNADGPAMRRVTADTRLREFADVMKLLRVDDWDVVYTDDAVHLALDAIPRTSSFDSSSGTRDCRSRTLNHVDSHPRIQLQPGPRGALPRLHHGHQARGS